MDDYIDHLLDCWAHPTPDGCTDTHRCDTAETLWAAALSTSTLMVPASTIRLAAEHLAARIQAREMSDTIREATEDQRARDAEEARYGR